MFKKDECIYQRVVGWTDKWTKTPVRMRARVRTTGSTLLGRGDNLT